MVATSLLPDDVQDDFETDDEQKFYLLASGARENLLRRLSGETIDLGPFTERDWKIQYVHELTAAADVYNIQGMVSAANALSSNAGLNQFDQALVQVLTKIKLRKPIAPRADSTSLSFATKEDIRSRLESLRSLVNNSNLSLDQKSSLHKRIDAVEAELAAKRFHFKAMWVLHGSLIMLAQIPALVGMASDLPGAIETVDQIFKRAYDDKAYEQSERQRRNAPALVYNAPLQIEDGRNHNEPI